MNDFGSPAGGGGPGNGRRVGLTYDLRDHYLALGYSEEEAAEFDSLVTIEGLAAALAELGYTVDRIGNVTDLMHRLLKGDRWEIVFNIAEGVFGFGREALIPALLDSYRIPYTFSDPCVLGITLHKGFTKSVLRDAGLHTANFTIVKESTDVQKVDLAFPLFAKPVAEGTGKGIDGRSKIENLHDLQKQCDELLLRFKQPVLVEEYLSGREFTVAIVGTGGEAEVLGTLEIIINRRGEQGAYSFQNKEKCDDFVEYRMPHDEATAESEELSLQAWRLFGCRDAGRVDIRLDAHRRPAVIEINPLAGIHPTHSDLPMIASAAGLSFKDLIGRIMSSADKRLLSSSLEPAKG